MIKVLFCKPLEPARYIEVENKLKPMQKLVGGHIETVLLGDGLILICNGRGKLIGLPLNGHLIRTLQCIVGPCFICRTNGDEFAGLLPGDMRLISYYFRRRFE